MSPWSDAGDERRPLRQETPDEAFSFHVGSHRASNAGLVPGKVLGGGVGDRGRIIDVVGGMTIEAHQGEGGVMIDRQRGPRRESMRRALALDAIRYLDPPIS